MSVLDLLRKRIDQVERSYGIAKAEFDEHGHEMDVFIRYRSRNKVLRTRSWSSEKLVEI